MANDCFYEMTVVGQEKDVSRLISIMRYEDTEWYIYRVFEVSDDADEFLSSADTGKSAAYFHGYVAWSAGRWVGDIRDTDREQVASNGAHYTNLIELSALLHLSIAVTTTEPGMGFCEFYHIREGELIDEDVGDYESLYFDDKEGMFTVRDIVRNSNMITDDEREEILGHISEVNFDSDGHADREFILDIGGWEHDFTPEEVDSDTLEHVSRSPHSETFPL